MNKIILLIFLAILSGCSTSGVEYSVDNNDVPISIAEELKRLVEAKRKSAGLVGLGAIVVQDGKIHGHSVSGERKIDSGSSISLSDKWHIGSITKSFTSTMIARLVEKGDLNWDTTVGDVFAGEHQIHSEWKNVTLKNLLTHTSGAKANFPIWYFLNNPEPGIDRMVARESAVKEVLARKPKTTPDIRFLYSNVGYTIAGVMAEKSTGRPWEDLIVQEVFSPLGINSGGFGAPKDAPGELSQPWGHSTELFIFTESSKSDNTPIIGPAGTIHISLKDLAQYGVEHLNGIKGRGTILTTDSYKRLHTPYRDNYAYGWIIGAPKELGIDNVHWHNGSNTFWYSMIAILPDINAVIAVTSNDGRFELAEQTSWEIIKHLIKPLSAAQNNSMNLDAVNSAG